APDAGRVLVRPGLVGELDLGAEPVSAFRELPDGLPRVPRALGVRERAVQSDVDGDRVARLQGGRGRRLGSLARRRNVPAGVALFEAGPGEVEFPGGVILRLVRQANRLVG